MSESYKNKIVIGTITDNPDDEIITGFMCIEYTGDEDNPEEISFDVVLKGKSCAFWCDRRMLRVLLEDAGVID